tara:strand:+ start:39596 stop:39751 length:156 start_codon:yes stop_codon:yes gene_type:complete
LVVFGGKFFLAGQSPFLIGGHRFGKPATEASVSVSIATKKPQSIAELRLLI